MRDNNTPLSSPENGVSEAILKLLVEGASWHAYVSHSWFTNRRRRERDSGLKTVKGGFRTREEAMQAAKDAISNRSVGQIDYAVAKPRAKFWIGSVAEEKIGELLNQFFLAQPTPTKEVPNDRKNPQSNLTSPERPSPSRGVNL